MSMLVIRPAVAADAPLLLSLIRGLADYEKLSHEVVATEEQLAAELGAARPVVQALVAERAGRALGFALYFFSFSTFLARQGLYLEDLYVLPEARGGGIGRALLVELARRAAERGCGRMEWSVLDWNVDAQRFYRSLGARPMDDWTVWRLDRAGIESLGYDAGFTERRTS
ncbi:MAG: GNAT family N-acetyltransferase [Steroidobacteraceae bacterium]|nr:GNAT family N-acetyltransferase [Steroidobacteraceae bacterium]